MWFMFCSHKANIAGELLSVCVENQTNAGPVRLADWYFVIDHHHNNC